MAGLLEGATGVLVDGEWRAGGPRASVRDKFTQLTVAEVQLGTEADAKDAVASAAAAARAPLPPAQRQQILAEAALLLTMHADEITANYIAETGFTRADAAAELARAASTLRLSPARRSGSRGRRSRSRPRRAARTGSRSPSGFRRAWWSRSRPSTPR